MKLVLVGQGSWTVYAICTDEFTCPLLDFIGELDEKRGAKALADLQWYVTSTQPGSWKTNRFSWSLRGTDSILEFRWPTKKGGTPRVLWFYDEGRVIVCCHGVNKKGTLDDREIRDAEASEARYRAAKRAGRLTIVPLEEFDPPDEEEN